MCFEELQDCKERPATPAKIQRSLPALRRLGNEGLNCLRTTNSISQSDFPPEMFQVSGPFRNWVRNQGDTADRIYLKNVRIQIIFGLRQGSNGAIEKGLACHLWIEVIYRCLTYRLIKKFSNTAPQHNLRLNRPFYSRWRRDDQAH